MNNQNADFTQGSILKKLFWFMVPILGALILQAAYGAVDLLVVGRFGSTSGLSAVSTGSQVLNLVTFVVTQLAMGITVLIARYLGEKRPEQIAPLLGGGALVFALISVGLCILLVCFARPISILMLVPSALMQSMASFVSQNIGAGNPKRAKQSMFTGIGVGLGFGCVVFALVMLKGDVLAGFFSTDAAVIQCGFDYLKGFAPETIVTAVLFSMVGYFNGNQKTVWVMVQGLVQTLLVRLPLAYVMSIQPNASLTKIGLAAPASTAVGILLNVGFYIYLNRKQAREMQRLA